MAINLRFREITSVRKKFVMSIVFSKMTAKKK